MYHDSKLPWNRIEKAKMLSWMVKTFCWPSVQNTKLHAFDALMVDQRFFEFIPRSVDDFDKWRIGNLKKN